LTDCGKHLLTASSIMDYLAKNIQEGKYNKMVHFKHRNPPETLGSICYSLAMLFKANAQDMATIKAMNNDTTSSTVKARLAISVMKQINGCYESITQLNLSSPNLRETYLNNVLIYLGVQRELFTAVVYYYLAQVAYEKKEVGAAISYCVAARERLTEQKSSNRYDHGKIGMPKFQGRYAENLGPGCAYLLQRINGIYDQADRDNRFIYFQSVENINTLLTALPAEACIMNPPAYDETGKELPPVVFVFKPKKGILGTIFSSMMGSATDPAATGKPSATDDTAAAGADTAAAATTADPTAPPSTAGGLTPNPYQQQTNQMINAYVGASAPPVSNVDSDFASSLRRAASTHKA